MKRILHLIAGLSLALLPFSASAMAIGGGDQYMIPAEVTINNDLYVGGGTLISNGTVNGDLIAGGGNITINGKVAQDAMIVGGNLNILGDVGDDLRAAGGNIAIAKTIKGDVVFGGGTFYLLKDAVIEGDLAVGGGNVVIDGTVKGHVRIGGGKVTINGTIEGESDITAGQELTFGPEAKVSKAVRYQSPQQAVIDPAAVIQVKPEYTKLEKQENKMDVFKGTDKKQFIGFISGLILISFIIKTLALLVATLVAIWLIPKMLGDIVERTMKNPSNALLNGFAWMILPPIAGIVLLFTIIGSLVGAFILVGYGLLMIAAQVITALLVGAWVMKLASKKITLDWKAAVLGSLIVMILSLIPFLGWIVALAIYLIALGGLGNFINERWNNPKK